MPSLSDHMWLHVLEIGTATRRMDHRALCRLAMVNSMFNQLSNDPGLWTILHSHQEGERFASFEVGLSPSHLSDDARENHDVSSLNPPSPSSPTASPLNLNEQNFIIDQRTSHLEHKFNRHNKGMKPKAISYSRYYVPLNRPPRRAMARKN